MYLDGLYFITDRKVCKLSYEEMTIQVLNAGAKCVQYRDKKSSRKKIYEHALNLRKITNKYNAVFIVNDHADISLAVNADGVHLGQNDLPVKEARRIIGRKKIIGISTHNLGQAIDAEKQGADYIGFGPVFHTLTKNAGIPMGTDILREIKKKIGIPVVAIGGINHKNCKSVLETGVDAIAVASAILKNNILKKTAQFMDIIKQFR